MLIADLVAAPYNPRKKLKPGDKDYEKLKRSIQEFGYVDPVIWNKQTGHVVVGHQRLEVLRELGWTEVDCVIIDEPQDKEKALNIALNKISGEWDLSLLEDLLAELDDGIFDISLTGFDPAEIEKLFGSDVKEDNFDLDKALKEPTISKLGDVCGRHRLVCGDSSL
jgi:ParB-like chromosome segregation protein Spo0J